MLEIGALFAFLGRQLGRLLNLAFNWATLILFGQVAKDKQLLLSIMALLSLVWPIALAGVAVPSVATFLLGLVTVPSWIENWVRVGMLVLALAAPLGVGYVSTRLRDQRPGPAGMVRSLLSGYPNAFALAVVLMWLMVVTPVFKILALLRRHETAHVPVAIKPGGYVTVVRDLDSALGRAGIRVRQQAAPWALALPGRILALVGGAGVRALVPSKLVQLRGRDLVITIHPMDLALTGKSKPLSRARAALVRELSFTEAYQTWTKESQQIEDALMRADRGEVSVETIARQLATIDLAFEEWEVLYRILLQVRLRRNPIGTDSIGRETNGRPGVRERLGAALAALRA
ncbi:MAG TPA: hypothetical protein VJP45_08295 [Candidatus Limnocylindria bacterium]|nr:hypothetical protein [Candidatus Limnocylindria bacterium]